MISSINLRLVVFEVSPQKKGDRAGSFVQEDMNPNIHLGDSTNPRDFVSTFTESVAGLVRDQRKKWFPILLKKCVLELHSPRLT